MERIGAFSLLYGMAFKNFPFSQTSWSFSSAFCSHKMHPLGLAIWVLASVLILGCDSQAGPELSAPPRAEPATQATPENLRTSPKSPQHTQVPSSIASLNLPRIVAFGDSLTAGFGVSQEQSYPSLLQQKLWKAGYRYQVINAGVSGDTTAGGLRRVNWILKSHPRFVILELGANDGLRGQPLDETYSNLEQIILKLQAEGVMVILAGMKIPPNYGEEYTTTFSRMYPRLAKQYGLTFMPFFLKGVATRPEFNQADGIHPTGEGYRIIANNLMGILTSVLDAKEQTRS